MFRGRLIELPTKKHAKFVEFIMFQFRVAKLSLYN